MLLSHARGFIEEAERLLFSIESILSKEYPKPTKDIDCDSNFEAIIADEAAVERLIQRVALELRLGCEMAAYMMLESRRKYFNESMFDSWQADKVVSFISDELEADLQHDTAIRSCRTGQEDIPESRRFVGETKGIKKQEFRKIYHSLGGLLHIFDSKSGFPKFKRLRDPTKAVEQLKKTIEYFRSFDGKMDMFFYTVANIHCTCGELISRPVRLLEKENFIECPNPECGAEWRAIKLDGNNRWDKEDASISVLCHVCGVPIPVPRKISSSIHRRVVRLKHDFLPTDSFSCNLVCLNKECSNSVNIVLSWSIQKA